MTLIYHPVPLEVDHFRAFFIFILQGTNHNDFQAASTFLNTEILLVLNHYQQQRQRYSWEIMMLTESNENVLFYPTRAKRTLRFHNTNWFYSWKNRNFKRLNVLTQCHKSKRQWRPAASVYYSVMSIHVPRWSSQWTHACTYAYFLYIWDIKSPWVIPQIILKLRK